MRKATITIEVECRLTDEHFAAWNDLTPEQRAVFDKDLPNCGDPGVVGHWCEGCPFCVTFIEEMEKE